MVNCVVIGVLAILAVVNGAVLSEDEFADGVLVPTPAEGRSFASPLAAAAPAFDCETGDLTGTYCNVDCKTLVVINIFYKMFI